MSNLRAIHRKILLVQYMVLWQVLLMTAPPIAYQVVMEIENLSDFDREYHCEKKLDLHWEDTLKQGQDLMWWQW